MTRREMREYLTCRYTEQSLKFPTMPRDITLKRYLAVNLPLMQHSDYWGEKSYETAIASAEKHASECYGGHVRTVR